MSSALDIHARGAVVASRAIIWVDNSDVPPGRNKQQVFDESAEEQTLDNFDDEHDHDDDRDNDNGNSERFPPIRFLAPMLYRPLTLCRPVPADRHSRG